MLIISAIKWRHGHDVYEGEKLMFSLKVVKNDLREMGVIERAEKSWIWDKCLRSPVAYVIWIDSGHCAKCLCLYLEQLLWLLTNFMTRGQLINSPAFSRCLWIFFWLCSPSSWGFMSMSVHMEGRRAEINLSTFLESPSLFFKIGSLIGLRIRLSWLTSVLQRLAHLFILMLGSQACATRPGFQYISQNIKNRKDFNLLRKFLQCLDLEP